MPQDTKNGIANLLGSFLKGSKTKVAVKEKSSDINILIAGIPQEIAIKHLKNLFEDILNGRRSSSSSNN